MINRLRYRSVLRPLVLAVALGAVLTSDGSNNPFDGNDAEFYFVRLSYSENGLRGMGRQGWLTDWPEAEQHLIKGISRLTRIDISPEGRYMSIMDKELFDHPWIYAVEVGGWSLSPTEAARLRDYLLRGGFLMVDDFHGTAEWAGFIESMNRVFPDRTIVDVKPEDAIFHTAYDTGERVQIPGIQSLYSGKTYEKDGFVPQWRGIYDDEGRLMVMINFNMDLGDAWEHADVPEYALQYTLLAYKYTINYIVYAMTH
jgi:Domain of unknown function (DUF4159)